MNDDGRVRALIRMIPVAKALEEQLEKSMHLEIYHGTGDVAIGSAKGLQEQVASVAEEAYVTKLPLNLPQGADDKQKVAAALLIATQIRGYLEGETGLIGLGGNIGNVQYAPRVYIQGNQNMTPKQMDQALGMAGKKRDAEPDEQDGA